MIVVAIVGLTLFGSITAMRMGSRANIYRSRALTWRMEEREQRKHLVVCRKEVEDGVRTASNLRDNPRRNHVFEVVELARRIAGNAIWWRANVAHTEEMLAYSTMMSRKYERASRYPWLAIAPDTPQPYWSGVTGPPLEEPEPADILEQEPTERAAERVAKLLNTVIDQPTASAGSQRTP